MWLRTTKKLLSALYPATNPHIVKAKNASQMKPEAVMESGYDGASGSLSFHKINQPKVCILTYVKSIFIEYIK